MPVDSVDPIYEYREYSQSSYSAMNQQQLQQEDLQYFSNESLEDKNSTTSSTEGSINVERRKDHEFIPTRMKTINASKPAANPQQFTKVPSNPLLISAQKQMMQVEEIKKAKELAKKQAPVEKREEDSPDWQSELSSWKSRRRKQSEETLMRVAEIKVMEEGEVDPNRRKISLGKKLSGLLHTDENDWSDLGLDSNPGEKNFDLDKRSLSKSPISEERYECEQHENQEQYNREEDDYRSDEPLERWTSSSSINNRDPKSNPDPVRRKSSEMSSTMKSRLEAFERQRREEEENRARLTEPEPDGHFREKLKNFQKISSQTEMNPMEMKNKPPPPLSYSQLIDPQNYHQQNSSKSDLRSGSDDDLDLSKDLDDALEESYRSVLEQQNSPQNKSDGDIYRENDFFPATLAPPSEKPPPPPPPHSSNPSAEEIVQSVQRKMQSVQMDDEIDRQEREIIASLEMEEREHKRYMEMKALAIQGGKTSPPQQKETQPQKSPISPPQKSPISPPQKSPISPTSRGPAPSSPQKKTPSPPLGSNSSKKTTNLPPKKKDSATRNYNQHWLIQEAEQRRLTEMQQTSRGNSLGHAPSGPPYHTPTHDQAEQPLYENSNNFQAPIYSNENLFQGQQQKGSWSKQQQFSSESSVYANMSSSGPPPAMHSQHYPNRDSSSSSSRLAGPQVPPRNSDSNADRLLSVSGKKKCSHCKEELGRGAAMIIESLRLFYHLRCFQCCVCHAQLGSGNAGTDVRVRNNKLHCHNCYSNDEGLKFSKV